MAVAVAAAMVLTGCGGGDADASKKKGDKAGDRGGAVAYAKCMRKNGIKDFPDPDGNGKFQMDGNKIDAKSEEFKKADEKCKSLLPDGGGGPPPLDGASEKMKKAAVKYAKCMRKNGVPDFPDPNAQGGIDINGDSLSVDPNSAAFKKADKKCQHILEKAAGGKKREMGPGAGPDGGS